MAVCVGCGLIVDGGTGLLQVHRDPAGHIACSDANGLSVDMASLISPDSCNGIAVRSNKLYAPCPKSIVGTTGVEQSPQFSGLPQNVTNGGAYSYNSPTTIHICNTTCCTVEGLIFVQASGIYVQAKPGFVGGGQLQVKINGGVFGSLSPSTRDTFSNPDATNDSFHDFNFNANLYVSLSAGGCVDYQWNVKFDVQTTGSGGGSNLKTDELGPHFVTRWQLGQTNCGC